MPNKIIDAIKTLYDNDINVWPDAMQHVFEYIEELESKPIPKQASKGRDVISHDRIMDEITILITRYLNQPDYDITKADQLAIKELLERIKASEEI